MNEDDLDVPVDTRPSRIAPRRGSQSAEPRDPGDPDDLASFDVKLQRFREQSPAGVIDTEVERHVDPFGVTTFQATARIWRESADAGKRMPDATAHSSRIYGHGEEPFASRALETAESVAIGRALRFLGHGTETSEQRQ